MDGYFVVLGESDVTGGEDVLYPSRERLASDLSSIGYTMPDDSALRDLAEHLQADRWSAFAPMVRAALRLYAQAVRWNEAGELSGLQVTEIETTIARAIAAW